MLVTNSTCIRKSLLIPNIYHNLGNSVAEGTVSEPKLSLWQDKIQQHLQAPQKTPNKQKQEYSKK